MNKDFVNLTRSAMDMLLAKKKFAGRNPRLLMLSYICALILTSVFMVLVFMETEGGHENNPSLYKRSDAACESRKSYRIALLLSIFLGTFG